MKNDKKPTTSLLTKTMRQFAACEAVCFVLTAPLFYLLTKYFYAEDMIDLIEALQRGSSMPAIDLERDIMTGMMLQFLLIFAVISLSMFVTIRFATRKLWRPFDDTLHKTEQFNLAQSDVPQFVDTDIQEFSRLSQSIDRLMRRDKETYTIQKEFTENASHELQTPLAIIRSKLDLLMQESLSEAQMRLVSDLYGLTTRMGHLNRNLLLLAKIENDQYAVADSIDLFSMIAESLPLYGVLQEHADVRLVDRRTNSSVSLRANPILTECLLKNLVVNAIRHTGENGQILLEVSDTQLAVSNTSADGRPLDAAKLFRRFHKDDDNQNGNGLGLAIVKAICDFHKWSVAYRFESSCHRFIVDFNPKNR